MHVLVTGADGFVGRHLTEALRARGDEVTAIGGPHARGGVDITDGNAVRRAIVEAKPEAVAHLAAQASLPAAIADPVNTFAVNVTGTLHVLEAVRAARTPRTLLAGSADVYGPQPPERQPLVETVAPIPANPYAASKLAAEALALGYARSYGLDVVVTRAFNHVGPGQDTRFVVASFAAQLAAIAAGGERVLRVGNLEAQRDFLDVRDVVAAYVALIDRPGDGGTVYNVASGVPVAIKELLRQLVTIARVPVEIREDPARMRPSDTPVLAGDATRLRERTGWAPTFALDRTLRDVYEDAQRRAAQVGA